MLKDGTLGVEKLALLAKVLVEHVKQLANALEKYAFERVTAGVFVNVPRTAALSTYRNSA
jgi:hypothetical protein